MTRRKSGNGRWASDEDANDLLANILDETAGVAADEALKLETAIWERQSELSRKAQDQERERVERNRARLEAEMERQAALERKRELKRSQLSNAQPVAPKAEEAARPAGIDADAIRAEIEQKVMKELREHLATPLPTPEPVVIHTRPSRAWVGLGVAATLALAAVAGAAIAALGSYSIDPAPYAKSIYSPVDSQAVAVEVGTRLVPEIEQIAPAPTQPAATNRVRRPKPATPEPDKRIDHKPDQNKANEAAKRLDDFLKSASDPFAAD